MATGMKKRQIGGTTVCRYIKLMHVQIRDSQEGDTL